MQNVSRYKIVMLTNGHVHGIRILENLKLKGISIDSVVLETRDLLSHHLRKGEQHYLFRLIKALRRYIIS